jgi:hypothetical protein
VKSKQDEVAKLQEELKALLDELKNVQNELEHADNAADQGTEEYAKASCQGLCRSIQQNLPREIRDLVWHYISTRDKVSVSYDAAAKIPCYFNMKFEVMPDEKGRISHYWNTEFVGEPTFFELAENYYRKSCFHFEGPILAIKMFLQDDTWGLGFQPGTLVTKVVFHFSPREICGKGRQLKLAQLWNLFNLKYRCSISIVARSDCEVPGWYGGQSFHDVKRLFEDIFPVACSLKKAGYGVKIVWKSLVPSYPPSFRPLPPPLSTDKEAVVERTVIADDREHSLMKWLELCAPKM